MADSQSNNGGRLRRNISKIAFRNKERVMRSIGRAEETKDEILDHYVMLITKQQVQMQKLQRDMKQYMQALKAMSVSQKAFYSSLYDVYDDEWAGKDVIASCAQRNESLYDDIFARFHSEVLELLQNHLSEYHKCKTCVEKRGRKLVDYDAAKRTVQAIETSKKPDPTKLEKSRENLQQTREIYEDLNNFLHQQLPTLHDSRLSVCVNIFSSICESENEFSTEVAELRMKLNTVLLNLKSSFDNGEYRIQRMQTPLDNGRATDSPRSRTAPPLKIPPPVEHVASIHNSDTVPAPRTPSENDVVKPSNDPSTHEYVNLQIGTARDTVKPVSEEDEFGSGENQGNKKLPLPNRPSEIDDSSEIPPIYEEPPREDFTGHQASSERSNHPRFPPNYLFSVEALYKYRSNDDDELSFGKGDIIHIIEHPDPDEQDDGWQMGIRQRDWDDNGENASSGVFPENFTKRTRV